MRRLPAAVAAILLGAIPAAPAPAGPSAVSGGLSCGLAGYGLVDTRQVTAVITGGPWYSDPGEPESQVFVRCTVEVEAQGGGRVVVADVREPFMSGPGAAVTGPAARTFSLQGALNWDLYLCTEVTVYDPGSIPAYRVHQVDADDDPSNGAQCEKTKPDDGDFVYTYQAPPSVHGYDSCVFVEHNLPYVDVPDAVTDLYPVPDPIGVAREYCTP